MKLSQKKIISFVIILLFSAGLFWGTIYLKNVADYKRAVRETTFAKVNISDVSDGVYIGEYDVNFILTSDKNCHLA